MMMQAGPVRGSKSRLLNHLRGVINLEDDYIPEGTMKDGEGTTNGVSNIVNLSGITGGSSNEANSPTRDGRTVRLDENPQMKALVGEDEPFVVVEDQEGGLATKLVWGCLSNKEIPRYVS